MKFRFMIVCLIALAAPLFASDDMAAPSANRPGILDLDLSCGFDFECLETEACADTTFTTQLKGQAEGILGGDMAVQGEMISDAGDTILLGARSGDAMSLAGGTFEARHLLTIAANGAARYTLHYSDGPMVISYTGTCQ